MNPQLEQIKAQLLADKKKLGIMIGLICVGLLLWGRLLLKDAPKTATANPTPVAAAPAPGATSIKAQRVKTDKEYDVTVVLDIPAELPRDLFALDTTGYRVVKGESSRPLEPTVEPNQPKEFLIAQAKEAARDLRLEGVIMGEEPSVIINGQLLYVGQTIEQFKVHKIEQRKVVLEMGGVFIRMSM